MELKSGVRVVLASQSPRRQTLLKTIYDEFEICVSDADESVPEGTEPARAVEMIAMRKAQAVSKLRPNDVVIGADTVVVVGGEILGKPADARDAAVMLRKLSGRKHQVYTGVAILTPGKTKVFSCCTDVQFALLTKEEINWYISTGEPLDKAGAYGIQEYGARFVEGIHGDFFNVMGLPVCALYEQLRLMEF